MQAGLRDRAKALAQALAATEEYQKLVSAREEVARHEAARIMLRDLKTLQAELERKQLAGEPVTDEELQHFQQRSQVIAFNPYVRDLLQAEMAFAQVMIDVQAVLTEELGLQDDDDGGEGPGNGDAPSSGSPGGQIVKPSSRLWTPG